jgi:hypothetical protein
VIIDNAATSAQGVVPYLPLPEIQQRRGGGQPAPAAGQPTGARQ